MGTWAGLSKSIRTEVFRVPTANNYKIKTVWLSHMRHKPGNQLMESKNIRPILTVQGNWVG